jgi:hypothetical protein
MLVPAERLIASVSARCVADTHPVMAQSRTYPLAYVQAGSLNQGFIVCDGGLAP